MATLKRLEKRVNEIESWVKDYENGTGPSQTMDNLNFLVGQTRMLAEQMQGLSNQNQELKHQLQWQHQQQKNSRLLQSVEKHIENTKMVV